MLEISFHYIKEYKLNPLPYPISLISLSSYSSLYSSSPSKMISTKKMIQIASKWQRQAAKQRKRIQWRKGQENYVSKEEGFGGAWATKAEKGHFVVYSTDKRRFVLPLVYLSNKIFIELFKLAEEEFGLCSNVPLMLPFDATLIEYVITLVEGSVAKDLEEALLISIANRRCYSYFDVNHHELYNNNSQQWLCSF
ncbi:Auxin-responsive protein [Arachis hypogaea]|nr:Auxin-responsive protein [Arachis hypogaea]